MAIDIEAKITWHNFRETQPKASTKVWFVRDYLDDDRRLYSEPEIGKYINAILCGTCYGPKKFPTILLKYERWYPDDTAENFWWTPLDSFKLPPLQIKDK